MQERQPIGKRRLARREFLKKAAAVAAIAAATQALGGDRNRLAYGRLHLDGPTTREEANEWMDLKIEKLLHARSPKARRDILLKVADAEFEYPEEYAKRFSDLSKFDRIPEESVIDRIRGLLSGTGYEEYRKEKQAYIDAQSELAKRSLDALLSKHHSLRNEANPEKVIKLVESGIRDGDAEVRNAAYALIEKIIKGEFLWERGKRPLAHNPNLVRRIEGLLLFSPHRH